MKLLTRSGLDWTAKFGKDMAAAFKALPVGTALIDGELVVENQNGASDFSLLQADLSEGRVDRFVYYAFDLMYLDGYDLRATPLVMRKEALAQLLAGERGILRYSEHFEQDGDLILQHACRLSLEGVISKLRDGPYRSGRGKSWVKSKCSQRQEFVVAGYVPSTTSRKAIGSLVLGYYDDGKLIHAGRVGTGYTATVAEDLYRRLERIRSPSSPFAERLSADAARQVRYVKPQLVAEVEFRGWTGDQNLRHASFRGLREDKAASEIVRETSRRQRQAAAAHLGQADPSRSGLLARRRRHQGGPGAVLCRGLAPHGAVHRRPAAGPGALPARHRRPVLLPEACLAGPEPQHPARARSQGSRGSAARDRRSRRADRPGPGGRPGDPSLGRLAAEPGAAGHDHHGSRSRRGGELAGGHRRRARGAGAACRRRAGQLRQDLGRQGSACRGAAEAEGRLAGGESLHQEHRRRHGGRQPGALRCHHHQVEAPRQDPGRLSAQRPRLRRRWRPTPPGPEPARRCRCRSPGTSLARASVPPTSRSTTPRRAWPISRPILGPIFAAAAVPLPAAKSRRKRAA